MNSITTSHFLRLFLTLVLGFGAMQTARAGHDHDHVFVTIDKYLGYDADSEISKVQVSTKNGTCILTMHGNLKAAASHVGEEARISVSSDGVWTHFAVVDHISAVRIHTRKRVE